MKTNRTSKLISGLAFVALSLGGGVGAHAGFTDITETAGLKSNSSSRGAGWGDYNGDGCVDLYVTRELTGQLFRNNCDGTFADWVATTTAAGIAGPAKGWAATWADYDNDGDLDIYIGAHDDQNALFQNQGDGTFLDVAVTAGVAHPGATTGASFADYDNDGDLDLFISNRFSNPTVGDDKTDALYSNNGDGTFTDVTANAGVGGSQDRNTFTGIWFDYDGDADVDLWLAVDFGDDVLYRNNGNGTFTDVSAAAGIGPPNHGMGVTAGDINQDGCLDVFVSNNNIGEDTNHRESLIYLNNCDGTFSDASAVAGIMDTDNVEWGVNIVDFDNDGDQDLSVVAGGMLTNGETNVLYENTNCSILCSGMLFDVTAIEGAQDSGAAFGSVWADYDNDGDLDWFVVNTRKSNRLYRNDGPTGNYLKVKLTGTVNNLDGVGSNISLKINGSTQTKVLLAGMSYAGSEELIAHFGLGQKTMADEIVVTWPGGGVTSVTNVVGNQTVEIIENDGAAGLGTITGTTRRPSGVLEPNTLVQVVRTSDQQIVASFTSDPLGEFSVLVPYGDYILTARKVPFKPSDTESAMVSSGAPNTNVDLTLSFP